MTGPISDAYQEHILNAPDTCSNCYSLIREGAVEWVPTSQVNKASLEGRPVLSRSGGKPDVVLVTHMPSRPETTAKAYPPREMPADSQSMFCECGVESAFDRIWSFPEVSRQIELGFAWLCGEQTDRPQVHTHSDARFRELLKNCLRTIEAKDVSVARKEFVSFALEARKDGAAPDVALSRGLEAGIQHAEIRSRSGNARPVSAD